jgi:photosystem II stability/assembly factor-like uncharacterized protein
MSDQPLSLFPEQNAKLTLRNTGSSTAIDIQINSTNPNLTFTPSKITALAPGATAVISLMIPSNNTGSSSPDQITAAGDDTNTATLPLKIVPIIFAKAPIQIGSGDISTWTLTNQGSVPIKTMNLSVSAPVTTTSESTCGIGLNPQASCQYVFTAPNDAQSQSGLLSFTADGASLSNKPIDILRPTYDINIVQLQLGISDPSQTQIPVNPSQKTIIQVVNNSPVMIKNFQVTLPNISNISFNNQCTTDSLPYNISPGSSCTIEVDPNDYVVQGDQGLLSFSEDNADTANSDYQIIVASQIPNEPSIQNFYLQSNAMIGTAGVNSTLIAFLNIQTPNQNSNDSVPLNLTINNGTSSCNINALNSRNSCGWEATQYQCAPLNSAQGNSNTQCMIELNYAIPPSPPSISSPQRSQETFTFLFDNQLPQTLTLTEMPSFYLFPKDGRASFDFLPVSQINDIGVDAQGSIYLGTQSGLLYSHDQGQHWKWLSLNDGLPSLNIQNLWIDGSTLYLANQNNLITLDIQQETPVIQRVSAAFPFITGISTYNGFVYLSTEQGGYIVDADGNLQGFPDFISPSDPEDNHPAIAPSSNAQNFYQAITHSGSSFYLPWYESCVGKYDLENSSQVTNLFCFNNNLNSKISISADNQGHLLVGGFGDIYLSQDSGQNFQNINTLSSINQTPIKVTFNHDFSAIAAGTTSGLAISKDLGNSWETVAGTEGLWIKNIYNHTNGSYYLTTLTGMNFNTDPNGNFSTLTGDELGDPGNAMSHIYMTPLNLYLIKSPDVWHNGGLSADLFLSSDRGLTFNKITLSKISTESRLFIITDPISLQDHLLLIGLNQALLSDDLGQTWTEVTPPTLASDPQSYIMSGSMCSPKNSQNSMDPKDFSARRLLISTTNNLYFSPDNGQSWNTLLTGEPIYQANYLSSSDCNEIIISKKHEIQTSSDAGKTWVVQFNNSAIDAPYFLTDSEKNIIIQQDTTENNVSQSQLLIGTPNSQDLMQYTWKVINTNILSADTHIVKIDQEVLYLIDREKAQLLSIPVSTLIQKSSLENTDWTVMPIPIKNLEDLGLDLISHPEAESVQIVGISGESMNFRNADFSYGVDISTTNPTGS